MAKVNFDDVSTKLTSTRQYAAMPSSIDPVTKLLSARAATAVDIAWRVFLYADPCELEPDLRYLREIHRLVRTFEAAHCGVLQVTGMSWDALAGDYRISRQSLHRRLAPEVDRILSQPAMSVGDRSLETIEMAAEHLREEFDAEVTSAPRVLKQLRKYPHWWHDWDVSEWFKEGVQE